MTWLTNPYRFGVAGIPPAFGEAHRYWLLRLQGAVNFLQYPSVAEWGLASSVGGSNLLSGSGGLTYSTQFDPATNAAANAFDGTTTTQWSPGTAGTEQWLAKDLGSAVRAVDWKFGFRSTSYDASRSPVCLDLDWSDDGTNWRCIASLEDKSYSSGEQNTHMVDLDLAAEYLNWRVYLQDPQGGGSSIGVREVEMAATVGGTDLCVGGTASHLLAFDDSATLSTTSAVSRHIRSYTHAVAVRPKEFRVTANAAESPPTEIWCQFQSPSDPRLWITVAGGKGLSWTGTQTKTFTNPYLP